MLLEDLLNLILKINDETDHNTFFRYYGHVEVVDINFHEGGWEENPDDYLHFNFKSYDHEKIKEVYNKLEKYLI